MIYLALAAGYAPLIGIMYYYAEARYYEGRQDERADIYEEDRNRLGGGGARASMAELSKQRMRRTTTEF